MQRQRSIFANTFIWVAVIGLLGTDAREDSLSEASLSNYQAPTQGLRSREDGKRSTETQLLQASPDGYVAFDGDCESNTVDLKVSTLDDCALLCEDIDECVGFSYEETNQCYIKTKTCLNPKVSNRVFYAKTSMCKHCYGVALSGTVEDIKGSCYLSPVNPSQCMMNGFYCSKTLDTGVYTKCNAQDDVERGNPVNVGLVDPEDVLVWDEVSHMPRWISTSLAVLWVTMVAGMPLIAIALEDRKITRVQIVTFVTMWVVFLGGVYLFTHIVLFQSIHFKQVRSLTTIEAVYFLAQILTTVGYGDITPAKPRGQVFVAFYVLVSLLVIANVTSQVVSMVQECASRMKKQLDEWYYSGQQLVQTIPGAQRLTSTPRSDELIPEEVQGIPDPRSIFKRFSEPPRVDYGYTRRMMFVYFSFVLMGVLFWANYPGENKTWHEGVYMSVITLSTVGFGVFTPQTEAGKVFAAFWMLWGSMALLGLVGAFAELHEQRKRRERWNPDEAAVQKAAFLGALGDKFQPYDFLKLYVLNIGVMKDLEMIDLETLFDNMAPGKQGTIKKENLETFFAERCDNQKPQVAG